MKNIFTKTFLPLRAGFPEELKKQLFSSAKTTEEKGGLQNIFKTITWASLGITTSALIIGYFIFSFSQTNIALAETINNTFALFNSEKFHYQEIIFQKYIDKIFSEEEENNNFSGITKLWEMGNNYRHDIYRKNEKNSSYMHSTINNINCEYFSVFEKDSSCEPLINKELKKFPEPEISDLKPFIMKTKMGLFLHWQTVDMIKTATIYHSNYTGYIQGWQSFAGTATFDEYIFYNQKTKAGFEHSLHIPFTINGEPDIFQIILDDKASPIYQWNKDTLEISIITAQELKIIQDEFIKKEEATAKNTDIDNQIYESYFKFIANLAKKLDEKKIKPLDRKKVEQDNIKLLKIKYNLKNTDIDLFKFIANDELAELTHYIEFLIKEDEQTIKEYSILDKDNNVLEKIQFNKSEVIEDIGPEEFFSEKYWLKSI